VIDSFVNHLVQAALAGAVVARQLAPQAHRSVRRGSAGLVTDADIEVERVIRQELTDHFSGCTIISEETHSDTAPGPLTFYVDPIDGTVNYAHGLPYCAVSIAARSLTGTVAAVVHDIFRKVSYVSEVDQPALIIDHTQPERTQLSLGVSQTERFGEALLITGFSREERGEARRSLRWFPDILAACGDVRRFGAASLDLATVAAGRADGYWETAVGGLWDLLAGAFLVSRAGGRCDVYFEPVSGRAAAVASNGRVHDHLVERTREQFAGYKLFERMGGDA
jgi:myo-inositol-1(or 4)-monophosphatase